jgi:hypothetical protein
MQLTALRAAADRQDVRHQNHRPTHMLRPEARTRIEAMSRHAVPLLVFPRAKPAIDGWLTGGTGILVRTPLNTLLITADHVLREIEALRQKLDVVVLLGGTSAPPIDVSDWPIVDRNARIDICIMQTPPGFDPTEINKSFYDAEFDRSPIARKGDEALIIGFPREHRAASGSVINTRMLPVIDFVRSVSEERFIVVDEKNERKVLLNPSGLNIPEHMGGASGAPVFRFAPGEQNALIGIFTDGGDGLHGVYLCTHAKFITNAGVIDSLQLPPN